MLGRERLPDRHEIIAGIKPFRNVADIFAVECNDRAESWNRTYGQNWFSDVAEYVLTAFMRSGGPIGTRPE